MAIYARSDLAYVFVSDAHGGCNSAHSRPVEHGAPAKVWKLSCELCADQLRKDPHWSSTPEDIPLTFDEQTARDRAEKSGKLDRENQLASALIELGKLGDLPQAIGAAVAAILGGAQAQAITNHVPGEMVCAGCGNGQPGGARFCNQCGSAMSQPAAKAELPPPPSGGKVPRLRDQPIPVLRGIAKAHGVDLPEDCKRPQMITLLADAGVTGNDVARFLAGELVSA